MELHDFLAKFDAVSTFGDDNSHYIARCPAHDDNRPSLVIAATQKKMSVKCYAGCSGEDILQHVGLTFKDLYFENGGNGTPPHAARQQRHTRASPKKTRTKIKLDYTHPTVVYSYTDEEGQELYQNCRFEVDSEGRRLPKKEFRQRHKTEKGWSYNLEGVRKVPYCLPELLATAKGFFDCEGEKDVNNLADIGAVATNIGKDASSWKNFATYGQGKYVIVCEDNDKAGHESARKRARFWFRSGASVKILTFRDMPEHSDVSDWLKSSDLHDIFALEHLALKAPIYHPLQDITIDFNYVPSQRADIMSINGTTILSEGNLSGIVSGIGRGKSHLVEMLAALAISPGCEEFGGIEVALHPDEMCMLIDTERTTDDCYYGLNRMWRRTGKNQDLLTPDKSSFSQFRFVTTSDVDKAARKERLLEAIETPRLKLLLIDGALDFVMNPNDIAESNNFVDWLFTLANRHKIGIFYTLHGNRNDTSGKGKGWLGDALQRRSSTYLLLEKWEANEAIRRVTSGFDNVKVRHGKDYDIDLAMQWAEELGAFKFIPFDIAGKDQTLRSLMEWSFASIDKTRVLKTELADVYMKIKPVQKRQAYRHIDKAVEEGSLVQENIGGFEMFSLS